MASAALDHLDALVSGRRAWEALHRWPTAFHALLARKREAAAEQLAPVRARHETIEVPASLRRLEDAHRVMGNLCRPEALPVLVGHAPLHAAHVLAGGLAVLKCRLDRRGEGDRVIVLEMQVRRGMARSARLALAKVSHSSESLACCLLSQLQRDLRNIILEGLTELSFTA